MTTVSFFMEDGRLTGFTVRGHSGWAEEGSDVVCAAVTSAVRLTECAVNDVLGLGAAVKLREKDAFLSLKLPGGLGEANEHFCQNLLAALMVYCTQLQEEYPGNVFVEEAD